VWGGMHIAFVRLTAAILHLLPRSLPLASTKDSTRPTYNAKLRSVRKQADDIAESAKPVSPKKKKKKTTNKKKRGGGVVVVGAGCVGCVVVWRGVVRNHPSGRPVGGVAPRIG